MYILDAESSSHYVWDSTEVALLEALNDCQLLLTYSTTTRVHSLYWIRKATKAEWKCAASKAESIVSCNTTLTPAGKFLNWLNCKKYIKFDFVECLKEFLLHHSIRGISSNDSEIIRKLLVNANIHYY